MLLTRCRENWYRGLFQLLLHPSLLPKFPLLLLQIPSLVRKDSALLTATMTRLVTPFYYREIQILLVPLLISPCWSLSLVEGSSMSAEHLWSLILLPAKGVAARAYLQILFPAPLSCFFCCLSCLCPRNSSLKLPKLSPAWCVWHQCHGAHRLLCPQSSPSTAFFCCTSSFSYH